MPSPAGDAESLANDRPGGPLGFAPNRRTLRWGPPRHGLLASLLVVPALHLLVLLTMGPFGATWAPAALQAHALARAGHELHIEVNQAPDLGGPALRLHAGRAHFANPGWARAPPTLTADGVSLRTHLGELLRGQVQARLRGLEVGLLLRGPALRLASVGRLSGDVKVDGHGPSVGRMLATAEGRLFPVARQGQITGLLVKQTGPHLLEILTLTNTGDEAVALNGLAADFGAQAGVLHARTPALDTAPLPSSAAAASTWAECNWACAWSAKTR